MNSTKKAFLHALIGWVTVMGTGILIMYMNPQVPPTKPNGMWVTFIAASICAVVIAVLRVRREQRRRMPKKQRVEAPITDSLLGAACAMIGAFLGALVFMFALMALDIRVLNPGNPDAGQLGCLGPLIGGPAGFVAGRHIHQRLTEIFRGRR